MLRSAETHPVDHHRGLLKSSWTRISTQLELHIISLQNDLTSAREIISISSSAFTPLSSHSFSHLTPRIQSEQHDAVAAVTPRRLDGVGV